MADKPLTKKEKMELAQRALQEMLKLAKLDGYQIGYKAGFEAGVKAVNG